MTQDNVLQDVQVGPVVHLVLGRGMEARQVDIAFSDLALEGDDAATISDADLLERVESAIGERYGLQPGSLRGRKITRPATGNILIGAQDEYGARL